MRTLAHLLEVRNIGHLNISIFIMPIDLFTPTALCSYCINLLVRRAALLLSF